MRQTALNVVYELAKCDPRVVFVGSDLGVGTLKKFKDEMPERFFMEGVAEQNIIGLAAGLAMEGFIPYVNTIATFITRRCFEQVAVDLCLHKLPVRLIGNGGGVVYAPLGPTHLAIEDIAIMRALPEMSIVAPADAGEMRRFVQASLDWPTPIYIRSGKGGDPIITPEGTEFVIGKAVELRPAADITFVATGVMAGPCLAAADRLAERGIACGVIHLPTVKPMDREIILAAAGRSRLLVSVEEHVLTGGLGGAIAELLMDHGGTLPRLLRLGLPDAFPRGYGSQDSMLGSAGLSPEGIAARVGQLLAVS